MKEKIASTPFICSRFFSSFLVLFTFLFLSRNVTAWWRNRRLPVNTLKSRETESSNFPIFFYFSLNLLNHLYSRVTNYCNVFYHHEFATSSVCIYVEYFSSNAIIFELDFLVSPLLSILLVVVQILKRSNIKVIK